MPNYVENILKLYGEKEDIARLLAHVKTDKSVFDFNTLIPMPESLNITSGSSTEISLAVYTYHKTGEIDRLLTYCYREYCQEVEEVSMSDYVKHLLQCGGADLSLGETAYNNKKAYGTTDWYYWCVEHWGTKWEALEASIIDEEQDIISFETAWSAPNPVIDKLAEMFPDVEIRHIWSDEDMGNNCGEAYYSCYGKCESDVYDGSQEAYAIYFECWGGSECLTQDTEGLFSRKSCEECHACD
jgi:hypothetical protein